MTISARAEIVTRRTYNREKDDGSFETWSETIARVINHQRWLWERALTHKTMPSMPLHDLSDDMVEWIKLNTEQEEELENLRQIFISRKALPSGRVLWLGGTDLVKKRESSSFNCAFSNIETVYDVVDVFWLLLQGCGVGAGPITGTLTGFRKPIENIKVINSTRTSKGGRECNEETFVDGVWTISVGDSAESWAKSIGKLLAGKYPAHTLIMDFSEIRPAGERLKGYGWISSGDGPVSKAYPKICEIMNRRAGNLLSKLDIIEVLNLLGTVLSSRRSAEIMLYDYGTQGWYDFATFKRNCYEAGHQHKQQSNNSLAFHSKPSKEELRNIFDIMIDSGGSEPGFINMETAVKRAPWAKGANPSLIGSTKVYTTDGIYPIKDLQDKEFTVLDINNKEQKAVCRLSGKNEELWKISLKGGHSYLCTAEHLWPVSRRGLGCGRDSWSDYIKMKPSDIKSGDCLSFSKVNSLFNLGTKCTYAEGLFLGWLQGDGWITLRKDTNKYQVGMVVSYKETEIIDKIYSVISKYSNAKFNKRDNGTYELNTQNKELYKYIKEVLLFVDKENIPTSIYDSTYSEDFRKGYIDGIFSSDGHIEKVSAGCKIRIGLTSSRESFITQMAELLAFYGIRSALINGTSKLRGYDKIYYNYTLRITSYDCVSHFNKLFNLSVTHKQGRLNTLIKPMQQSMVNRIKIIDIEKTNIKADVWDIGVYADSHTFKLAFGTTGNCCEILLGSKSFCNLVEIDVAKFSGDSAGLHKVATLLARANYRQTVVDFRDGVLQEAWHLNNEFLRLCGVGVTGIAQRDDMTEYDWKDLRYSAVTAARGMALELDLQHPKNVTTVKPSGTLSKIMDTTEGVHRPEGKYLFNWINFSIHDPLVPKMKTANYKWQINPTDDTGILFCLPVKFGNVNFDKVDVTRKDGTKEILEVTTENAINQLERYKKIQVAYCDQNVSNTIYYKPEERDDIVDWLLNNWDIYVGVSFLFKNDPTVSAADLGFNYLPQEYVTEENYEKYANTLLAINFDNTDSTEELSIDECASGACPIK